MWRAYAENNDELPRYHKRAFAHNYKAPFIYHIILKKQKDCLAFGEITGDAKIRPGCTGCARVRESNLGEAISKGILCFQYQFPFIQVYQFVVMPDHIHILLNVTDWLEHELDHYIEIMVKNIAHSYSLLISKNIEGDQIFEIGFCDKPLLRKRSLNGLYQYIRQNPHRLAMRQQYPQFFQRVRRLKIANQEYESYGNLFLFRNPEKTAVIIRSAFTQDEVNEKKNRWLESAGKGTVLVSPFISKSEKSIRSEAEVIGANIILITHEAFGERFKPAAHDFDLCSKGRLLILSFGMPAKTPLSREICLQMNALATVLAE